MTTFKDLEKPVSFTYSGRTYTWGLKNQFVLFAGPDIIEDEGMVLETGKEIKRITAQIRCKSSIVFTCHRRVRDDDGH